MAGRCCAIRFSATPAMSVSLAGDVNNGGGWLTRQLDPAAATRIQGGREARARYAVLGLDHCTPAPLWIRGYGPYPCRHAGPNRLDRVHSSSLSGKNHHPATTKITCRRRKSGPCWMRS